MFLWLSFLLTSPGHRFLLFLTPHKKKDKIKSFKKYEANFKVRRANRFKYVETL